MVIDPLKKNISEQLSGMVTSKGGDQGRYDPALKELTFGQERTTNTHRNRYIISQEAMQL